MAEVTELITKFSFQGSTAPLGKYNQELGSSIKLMAGATAALFAVSAAITSFVKSTLAGADAQGQLAINTGVSVETIQELGFVASVSGSTVGAMAGTIDGLSKTIGEAAQKGNDDFARLGISVRDSFGEVKKADTILFEVGKRFKDLNLSMQEQQGFAESLGIDRSLLQLLNRSGEEMLTLRKRARELGIVTKEQQKGIIEFNDSFTVLGYGINAVKQQIAIGLSPQIKAAAVWFTDTLAANKDWVINGLVAAGNGIGVLVDALFRLSPVIGVMVAGFIALQLATGGWAAIMAVAFSPVVLITAGIVALLVIIDDLIVAFRGGKSVIRDFFLEFFGLDITPVIQKFVADFLAGFELIKNVLMGLYTLVLKPWIDGLGLIGSAIGNFFGGGKLETTVNQNLKPGQNPLASGPISNQVTQTNSFEIKTNDPQAAADAVGNVLNQQMTDAQTQLKRGGR